MKKDLLFFLLFSICNLSFSQNQEAINKYQDAELAFNNKDFKTTLDKLNEAEKLLGKSLPKITYLRILAFSELAYINSEFIVKTETEIGKYVLMSKKFEIDNEKLNEVLVLKNSLRKSILQENTIKEKEFKQQIEDNKKIEDKKKEIEQLFNSFSINLYGLTIGKSGSTLAAWMKENKRKINGHNIHLANIIKMISDKTVFIETYLKQSEYTGGFIYSSDKSSVAGLFLCPIYTENQNKLEEQFEIQKQLLFNHFGASNFSEISQITTTDKMFKCVKWNDNSKGLICTGIMYENYYSWVFTIKIDYSQLKN